MGGFSQQRGSFAEAVGQGQDPMCLKCGERHPLPDQACLDSQIKRLDRELRERLAEVKRYLKATGDPAAKGFLEMEAEDSVNTSDPRWLAWNKHGGSRRCRVWLKEQDR